MLDGSFSCVNHTTSVSHHVPMSSVCQLAQRSSNSHAHPTVNNLQERRALDRDICKMKLCCVRVAFSFCVCVKMLYVSRTVVNAHALVTNVKIQFKMM